jgi:hypothetical protein
LPETEYCCELFKSKIEKGHIEYNTGYWAYFFETNPINGGEEYSMPDVSPIQYCPFCGKKLVSTKII